VASDTRTVLGGLAPFRRDGGSRGLPVWAGSPPGASDMPEVMRASGSMWGHLAQAPAALGGSEHPVSDAFGDPNPRPVSRVMQGACFLPPSAPLPPGPKQLGASFAQEVVRGPGGDDCACRSWPIPSRPRSPVVRISATRGPRWPGGGAGWRMSGARWRLPTHVPFMGWGAACLSARNLGGGGGRLPAFGYPAPLLRVPREDVSDSAERIPHGPSPPPGPPVSGRCWG